MKHTRKLLSLLLALVMVLGLATTAFAQTINYEGEGATENGKITIRNAAKGETYRLVKLFDATVSENGNIAYHGTIPKALSDIFEKTNGQNITLTGAPGKTALSETDITALKEWAEGQNALISATSNGEVLEFDKLPYGYYVILSTQNNGAAITVDSTNPQAVVFDKNTTDITATKTADDKDIKIGQTVTYTLEFDTVNFYTTDDGKSVKVICYEISDTLPKWLSEVNVTSITIDNTPYLVDGSVPQFNDEKIITISWVDGENNSLYNTGAKIVITYTAKLNGEATIGSAGNTNTVKIQPKLYDTPSDPWKNTWEDSETVKTYAVAMQKVEEGTSKPLAGAEFTVAGLDVAPVDGQPGVYKVTNTNTGSSSVMTTDDQGYLVILGLDSEATVLITETKAPDGYVLQTTSFELRPVCTNETIKTKTETVYYDEAGNVTDKDHSSTNKEVTHYTIDSLKVAARDNYKFENVPGTELPTTGGIGTTIFYVLGIALVLGAGVLLVTKKRSAKN